MKKVFKVIINEGIFHVVVSFFVLIAIFIAILLLIASGIGASQVPKSEFVQMLNDREILLWSSIFVPAVVISLLIGVCMTLWKMKWPTREENLC